MNFKKKAKPNKSSEKNQNIKLFKAYMHFLMVEKWFAKDLELVYFQ